MTLERSQNCHLISNDCVFLCSEKSEKMPVSKMPVNTMTVDKMTVDKMPVYKMKVDKMPVYIMTS